MTISDGFVRYFSKLAQECIPIHACSLRGRDIVRRVYVFRQNVA